MSGLNLIHFLDFYFTFMFLASTIRRVGQYREVLRLVWLMPGRWPRLLELVKEHRTIFMTWATAAPALFALGLMLVQIFASRSLWPEAGQPPSGLTLAHLGPNWPALIPLVPFGLAMLALDVASLIWIGDVDRTALEKNFDDAEYWLRSPTAHVVRAVTFGYVNPRGMVRDEVRKSLVSSSDLLNKSLWYVTAQIGVRFAFGLTLWLTWALSG